MLVKEVNRAEPPPSVSVPWCNLEDGGAGDIFDVGATFEMRETNTEKSIFRLIKIAAAQRLINGRR